MSRLSSDYGFGGAILEFFTSSEKEQEEVAEIGSLMFGSILSLASLVIGFIANIIYISSSSWIGALFAMVFFIVGFAVTALGCLFFYIATKGVRHFFVIVPIILFCLGIWFAT